MCNMKETRTPEKNREYNSKYKTIRISVEDYNELVKVYSKTKVPLVSLIGFAVPILKRKYRIKEVVDEK